MTLQTTDAKAATGRLKARLNESRMADIQSSQCKGRVFLAVPRACRAGNQQLSVNQIVLPSRLACGAVAATLQYC